MWELLLSVLGDLSKKGELTRKWVLQLPLCRRNLIELVQKHGTISTLEWSQTLPKCVNHDVWRRASILWHSEGKFFIFIIEISSIYSIFSVFSHALCNFCRKTQFLLNVFGHISVTAWWLVWIVCLRDAFSVFQKWLKVIRTHSWSVHFHINSSECTRSSLCNRSCAIYTVKIQTFRSNMQSTT